MANSHVSLVESKDEAIIREVVMDVLGDGEVESAVRLALSRDHQDGTFVTVATVSGEFALLKSCLLSIEIHFDERLCHCDILLVEIQNVVESVSVVVEYVKDSFDDTSLIAIDPGLCILPLLLSQEVLIVVPTLRIRSDCCLLSVMLKFLRIFTTILFHLPFSLKITLSIHWLVTPL